MKHQRMLKYFISGILLLVFANIFGQNDVKPGDSVVYQQKYGLRVGGDLNKLVRSFVDDNYKGFEVNADYRITQNLYVAGELGTEEKTTDVEFFDAKTSGSYFKAGLVQPCEHSIYKTTFRARLNAA